MQEPTGHSVCSLKSLCPESTDNLRPRGREVRASRSHRPYDRDNSACTAVASGIGRISRWGLQWFDRVKLGVILTRRLWLHCKQMIHLSAFAQTLLVTRTTQRQRSTCTEARQQPSTPRNLHPATSPSSSYTAAHAGLNRVQATRTENRATHARTHAPIRMTKHFLTTLACLLQYPPANQPSPSWDVFNLFYVDFN